MQSPPSSSRMVLRMGKTLEARTMPGWGGTQSRGPGRGRWARRDCWDPAARHLSVSLLSLGGRKRGLQLEVTAGPMCITQPACACACTGHAIVCAHVHGTLICL